MGNDVVFSALMWTGGGTVVVTLLLWVIKRVFKDLNSTATDHVVQGATRAQVESLREEIGRLESLVKDQSKKVDRLNKDIVRLRLAFIDEQAALLRVLGEFNAHMDPSIKARVAQELAEAGQRRQAVLNDQEEPASCQAA